MNKRSIRIAHNFLREVKNNDYSPSEIDLLNKYIEYAKNPISEGKKVAMMLVSVNANYYQYTGQVVEDIQKNFLPGHKTDIFLWTDMPQWDMKSIDERIENTNKWQLEASKNDVTAEKRGESFFNLIGCYLESLYLGRNIDQKQAILGLRRIGFDSEFQKGDQLMVKNVGENAPEVIGNAARDLLNKQRNVLATCKISEIEPIEWPFGTLMRYSMFLEQEEKLKEYDYIFYMDVDMRIVNIVGDEILGQGLTMAEHPMYSLRHEYVPPYEPNKESTAYVPRFAKIINENGKPRLKPLYAAGGFQGGVTSEFLQAMKSMKKSIDKDLTNNYIAIWNDESHWNKYLFDYTGDIIALSPSYVYPDSLINEYYKKVWGRDYPPKIITITKSFQLEKIDAGKFSNM